MSCGICDQAICKKCVAILEKGSFPLLNPLPKELSHRTYCGTCYDEKVGPALEDFRRNLVRAKGVFVFYKNQGEETRLMRRSEKRLQVLDGVDRAETLLRLAFLAVNANFNALIDVEVFATKVRNKGYQTSKWQGSGIPTTVDAKALESKEKKR